MFANTDLDNAGRMIAEVAMRSASAGAIAKARKEGWAIDSAALSGFLAEGLKNATSMIVDETLEGVAAGMQSVAFATLQASAYKVGIDAALAWHRSLPVGVGHVVVINDGPDRGLQGRVTKVVPHPTCGMEIPCYWIEGNDWPVPSNLVEVVK